MCTKVRFTVLLCICMLGFGPGIVYAQAVPVLGEYIKIEYDNNGNRIRRSLFIEEQSFGSGENARMMPEEQRDSSALILNLYPNPSSDVLFIDFSSSSEENAEGVLYDVKGTQLKRMNLINGQNQIAISQLAPGEYLFHVRHSKTKRVWRLIKTE